jgi:hypothetical protein
MDDLEEHALVVKALTEGLSHWVLSDRQSAQRVRDNDDLQGLTLAFIRQTLISFVRANGGQSVRQIVEKRREWRDGHRFFYKVNNPLDGFKKRLFVEIRLTGYDDPDVPEVMLVSAHF